MAKPIKITILGDAKSLQAALAGTQAQLGGFERGVNKAAKFSAVAFVGIGAAGFAAAGRLDEAYDKIRIGTGATGEDLEGLEGSFKNVASTVPNSFDEVATAIADLNTRTGLTGTDLEALSTQMLELSRITGTDVATNIENVTRVFGDWDIAAADQAATMDQLFRASQMTGIGVDQLSTSVVSFGAPMRSLGFSFDESVALLSKFEKEGVNTEAVLAGMKAGLGKMAKAGEEPAETLARLQEEIANAGTEGEAMAIAVEAFGTRAGPDLAAAIREGRFEVAELATEIADGDETISGVAAATDDWREKLAVLTNKVMIKATPVLEKVTETLTSMVDWLDRNQKVAAIAAGVIGGLMAATLAYKAVAAVTSAVTKAWTVAQTALNLVMSLNPITLVVIAIAALVAGVIVAYKHSETFRNMVQGLWDKLKQLGSFIAGGFTAAFDAVFGFITGGWDAVVGAGAGVIDWFAGLPGEIAGFARAAASAAAGLATSMVSAIVGKLVDVITWYVTLPIEIARKAAAAARAAGDLGVKMAERVLRGLGRILEWYLELGAWIRGAITGIAQAAAELGTRMAARVVSGLGDIVDWFAGLPGEIGSFVDDVGTEAAKIGLRIVDEILNQAAAVIGWFIDLPGEIGEFVTDVASAAVDIGAAIVSGLKNGISEAWGAFIDWLWSKLDLIPDALMSFFGISSPSRLMAGFGRNIVEGLGKGIGDGFGTLVETPMVRGLERVRGKTEAEVAKLAKGVRAAINSSFDVRRARAGDDPVAQAKLDLNEANQADKAARRALARADKAIADAKASGNEHDLKDARADRRQAIDDLAAAKADQINAERFVREARADARLDANQAAKDIADSQREIEIAKAESRGDDVRVAQLELERAEADLEFANANQASEAERNRLRAEVIDARTNLRQATDAAAQAERDAAEAATTPTDTSSGTSPATSTQTPADTTSQMVGEVHVHVAGGSPATPEQIGAAVIWAMRMAG